MGIKLLYLYLLVSFSALSQNIAHDDLFSTVINKNIKSYITKSQNAYRSGNFERADFLFDSLINHVINGSYLDNFEVRKTSGRKIELNDFKKPIFLMTYSSWCTPDKSEIPALNKIAKKYHKEIDFIILFWDTKETVKKIANKYNRKITVVYVDENENTNQHIVETMKHSLGFPTSFFIDKTKKIVDVRRGVLHHFNEDYNFAFELNYSSFLNGISLLKNTSKTTIATNK